MPANLTPQYHKAEQRFKAAGTDEEKIAALEEMMALMPKHKGTEHLQAELKKKMSKLKKAADSGKKGGGKKVDIFHVPKSGAGQVALIGTANCGKSSIVAALSNAPVKVEAYPFSTDKPVPGMIKHEDVQIQLVDMPPIGEDFATPGQVNAYRNCDLIAIVIDIAADALVQMETCVEYLNSHRLLPSGENPQIDAAGNNLARKTFVITTKADLAGPGDTQTLKELTEYPFEYVEVSAETGRGLDELAGRIYEMLEIVRVYSKKPGKEADLKDPFTLAKGSTVADLATLIHRELAEKLKSARAWGAGVHPGQNVPRDHILCDKDIIELHFG